MTITRIENPYKNLLERLKEEGISVRINYIGNYIGEKNLLYIGKINEITKQDVSLLPHAVWEPVPTPNTERFLNRYRLETRYPKIIPLINILPETLSENYIEDFIKLQNYFNSLMIPDKTLRDRIFDKKIYSMPSEKEIKSIEKSFPTK